MLFKGCSAAHGQAGRPREIWHEMVDLDLSGKHGKQTQSSVHLPWRYFESTCAVFTELELDPTRVQIGLL